MSETALPRSATISSDADCNSDKEERSRERNDEFSFIADLRSWLFLPGDAADIAADLC